MAQHTRYSCFDPIMKYSEEIKANHDKQGSRNEAHKSIDYTKGNIHIANNELIWQTP